jgi:hypothetical protein
MGVANGAAGHWQVVGTTAAGSSSHGALESLEDTGGTWDAMEAYFECITTCSLEDGECVTRCVEELREQS